MTKKKVMWGCGGLLGAMILPLMIGGFLVSRDREVRTAQQSAKQAEQKETKGGQSAADETARQDEELLKLKDEQRERQRAEEERQRGEEDRSKSKTAGLTVEPNSYYKFYSDGSCHSSGTTVCLERDTFEALCRKTKRFENKIFDVLAEYDSTVLALNKNMGYSAFTDAVVFGIDEGAPCAIDFYAKGALSGNSIEKHYACPVITIKSSNDKVLSASSIDPLACIIRK